MSFSVKDILSMEVAPALGCTEPGAIALGAAAARSVLPAGPIDSIQVWVDQNVYKNGLGAAIPGAEDLTGIDIASALGAVGGNPELKLQVLDSITPDHVNQARELIRNDKVDVQIVPDQRGIFIKTVIRSGNHAAESVIQDTHDHIVSIRLNNDDRTDSPLLRPKAMANESRLSDLETWLKGLSLKDLIAFIDQFDQDDLDFLKEGVRLNMLLADYGLKHGSGLGVGLMLERLCRQKLLRKDMVLASRIITSAAADARMAGVKLPAMSSAGSGNHGLTATLPIWAVKDYAEVDENTAIKAVGLSHIITGYVKAFTGRLSAVCGCSIAAGAGAAAGVTYLLGGDTQHIAGAVINLTEDLAGIICDGAKAGCALKLATAAGTAVQAALFALQGIRVKPTDGIVGSSMEINAQNLGRLSTDGMIETDRTILKIMLDKKFVAV